MPEIIVFTGSNRDYEAFLKNEIDITDATIDFLELIRIYNSKIRATQEYAGKDLILEDKFENVIVRADDFGSVLSHVVNNFAKIATEGCLFDRMYVQNPPKQSLRSLRAAFDHSIRYEGTNYPRIEKRIIRSIFKTLRDSVLGQDSSKKEIITSLYQLSAMNDHHPIVLLFYGPSGVGKTETAKCLSKAFGGELTRVQFSMFQNAEAYDYVFGAEHSRGSFARDLLGRESNVILLDEFDKANPRIYNAFYELFDEGVFVDSYYRVEMDNALFILTSNFNSEREIVEALGPAMFSRISVCVKFEELGPSQKRSLLKRFYNDTVACLDEDDKAVIGESNILNWFIDHADQYDNIRIMKTKMERAIFGLLSARLMIED